MDEDILYKADLTGELKLTKTGEWLHEEKPFSNEKLKQLFFRSIHWSEEEKKFYLKIGKGRADFKYEDTVYFVETIELVVDEIILYISDGTKEKLDFSSLCFGKESQIYCTLKAAFKARFSRSAHQHLLNFTATETSIEVAGKQYFIAKCS
ncbi:MAG: DUF1285 domain-containing protein [Bdellovibrionales bacterium]|nr:DUF1285 domain-containing protein [Bdellovibrionales bacterium]